MLSEACICFWRNYNFEPELTRDGSPTLRWTAHPQAESMHHRGGAFSETCLIYGKALEWGFTRGVYSVASVGLGLGYNEILTAVYSLKYNIPTEKLTLLSFEVNEALQDTLVSYIEGTCVSSIGEIYDLILGFFESSYGFSKEKIKSVLIDMKQKHNWLLLGPLSQNTHINNKVGIWLYDAFSSKTSPELWSENFLRDLFKSHSLPCSVLSTYACTGALRRALIENDFKFLKAEGFEGKRNSSFAFRE